MFLRISGYGLLLVLLSPVAASAQAPADDPPELPAVQMTEKHRKMVHVQEGDLFPNFELPRVGGEPVELSELRGKAATVVLLWEQGDDWMTRAALTDLAKDIPRLFGKLPVSIVGIAGNQDPAAAQATLGELKVQFPHLVDPDGKAVDQLTDAVLPHIYALDAEGKVVWFDIEYSEASRRELRQAIEALTQE